MRSLVFCASIMLTGCGTTMVATQCPAFPQPPSSLMQSPPTANLLEIAR